MRGGDEREGSEQLGWFAQGSHLHLRPWSSPPCTRLACSSFPTFLIGHWVAVEERDLPVQSLDQVRAYGGVPAAWEVDKCFDLDDKMHLKWPREDNLRLSSCELCYRIVHLCTRQREIPHISKKDIFKMTVLQCWSLSTASWSMTISRTLIPSPLVDRRKGKTYLNCSDLKITAKAGHGSSSSWDILARALSSVASLLWNLWVWNRSC